MYRRTLLFFGAGILLVLPVTMHAQDSGAAWQNLMVAGLKAASAKDYKGAEDRLQKAVQQAEQFPAGDARRGTALNTLGLVFKEEKKNADAEKAFEKALGILEKAYGPASLDVANVSFNIATVQMADGHYESALPYVQKSRAIYEKILGAESLKAASTYCMEGIALRNVNKFNEAEPLLKQCSDMREASGGMENPELADALYNLALVYQHQGKFALADPRLKMAARIRELTSGVTSPELAQVLEAHANLLKQMGRDADAEKDQKMAEAIRRLGKTPK